MIAKMRTQRLLVPLVVTISLVFVIDSFLAQNRKKQEASEISTSRAGITEQDKESKIKNTLTSLLANLGVHVGPTLPTLETQTFREIRVRWQSSGTPPGLANLEERSPAGILAIVDSMKRSGPLPRQRSVELSTNQLLVIAVDQNSELRWWTLLLDPRLVRAEVPGATGETGSENYYVMKVDFMVAYPDDPAIRELRFYHPVWTGEEFHLQLLSVLSIT